MMEERQQLEQEITIQQPVPELISTAEESSEQGWKMRTGLNEDSLCGAIETLIFMSDKPVSVVKLKQQIDNEMPLRVLYEAIGRLQQSYETSIHGIRLIEVAQGYQFRTRPTYSSYVQKIFRVSSLVLPPTHLEVMAIIAYRGPLTRGDVDQLRGTDSSHIIRGLIDKRLVRVLKRAENEMGRQVQYEITPEFLEIFGLNTLKDLPPQGELEALAQESSAPTMQDMAERMRGILGRQFDDEEWKVLETLDQQIKSIRTETFLTESLKAEETKVTPPVALDAVEMVPVQVKKTAFEILEECLIKDEIRKENIRTQEAPELLFIQRNLLGIPASPPPSIEEVSEVIEEQVWETDDMVDESNEEFMDEDEIDEIVEKASELDLDLQFLSKQ